MESRKVTFCPRCIKPVETKEYFSAGGMSDWRANSAGATIVCSGCGYSGLPIQASLEDYEKLMKRKK